MQIEVVGWEALLEMLLEMEVEDLGAGALGKLVVGSYPFDGSKSVVLVLAIVLSVELKWVVLVEVMLG